MLSGAIKKLVDGHDLEEKEIVGAMNCIMDGNATQAQIGSFLTALRIKGETIEEITGCARVMRDKASRIYPEVEYFVDIVGTGGDCANTFNISTAVAFVTAAAGVTVAKHGNRSVSSRSGSADVLEALGINISLTPETVKECIEKVGMGFMFAQTFHKSMKHAAGARRELGIRTVFNVLGPLTNPADAKGQVLGVYSRELVKPIAQVLLNLGVQRAMVVHGSDGLDEITTTGLTFVSEVIDGKIKHYEINPQDYGIKTASKSELVGGDAKENADIIQRIFNGQQGTHRDVVLLNAAAALYVGKAAADLKEGIQLAKNVIDSGKAMIKLQQLREFTNAADANVKN